ncbi:MAG TPA: hypothetical protein VIK74_07065 [Parasegetibacter sp.]
MQGNPTFLLNFHTGNARVACSLMDIVLNQINTLQDFCSEITALEVLVVPSPLGNDQKSASITVESNGQVITVKSLSRIWEDALMNAFDSMVENFRLQSLGAGDSEFT